MMKSDVKPRKKIGRPEQTKLICEHCMAIKSSKEMAGEGICKSCYNTEMGVSNG